MHFAMACVFRKLKPFVMAVAAVPFWATLSKLGSPMFFTEGMLMSLRVLLEQPA